MKDPQTLLKENCVDIPVEIRMAHLADAVRNNTLPQVDGGSEQDVIRRIDAYRQPRVEVTQAVDTKQTATRSPYSLYNMWSAKSGRGSAPSHAQDAQQEKQHTSNFNNKKS